VPEADDDEAPRPLAVEGRPIYKKIDKYERAGDKNCLEPAWKGHWEELRVDMITALTLALLFDALLEETTEAGGTTYGPIILEAFHLGCGLRTGLKAPAQSLTHVRWMAISIINKFLPKSVLRDLFQSKVERPISRYCNSSNSWITVSSQPSAPLRFKWTHNWLSKSDVGAPRVNPSRHSIQISWDSPRQVL
jgi:hypothetical protein